MVPVSPLTATAEVDPNALDAPAVPIGGHCAPEFAGVRTQFERNFAIRGDVGAAVAAWVDGQLVVNLWGGWRDAARRRRWRQDTLASVFSGSKGLASTCLHLLAERGVIDLNHEHIFRVVQPTAEEIERFCGEVNQ